MQPLDSSEFDLPIYQDPERYDAEHWWKTDDIPFWQRLATEYGPRVLELAAGTGRLALPILNEGVGYTGIEISARFAERARTKIAAANRTAQIITGDIRHMALEREFDLIFIGFNSFLHLLTDADAQATLQCVRKHSHAETRFIIDIFVPDPIFLYRPEGLRVQTMTYPDPDGDGMIVVDETNSYIPEHELNHIRWFYSKTGTRDFLVHDFTMRMYFPDTMDRLLTEAGFTILEKWGDYERTPFSTESHLQIYVARPGN